MHKPTLAQHAAFIVRNMNGDAEWLRDDLYTLQAFVCKYLNFHRHKATGLFYWETDEDLLRHQHDAPEQHAESEYLGLAGGQSPWL